jgi:aminoglycoside phosphotransferase family enzyme
MICSSRPVSCDLVAASEQVERVDTANAVLFLAGAYVYKLKRAVKFPFMDLSTLDKRRDACEAESP